MKVASIRRAGFFCPLLAGFVFLAPSARAAVGVTISPSIITNDFVGKTTLTITGLASGKTVRVEEYADLNANGLIDSNDQLVGAFLVTDGQAPSIAGVRNLNAPGDDDGSTNGQIRVEQFVPGVGAGLPAGSSIIRVADPLGGFTAVTQPWTVLPRIYQQGVTGHITSAANGHPLTNGLVGSVNPNSGAVAFTSTDTNGAFTAYSLPGVYLLAILNSKASLLNDYSRQSVYVPCGQFVSTNLALASGSITLAGKVTDAATGAGVPAVFLDANSTNGLTAVTVTDTNGDYSMQVTPNIWSIHPTSDSASGLGYVAVKRSNVPVSSANVSNVNFALSKPTALIYGTVKDTMNNPLNGVSISGRDQANNYRPSGRSFAPNGTYCLAVLVGTWSAEPDSADLASLGYVGMATNVVVVAGQATNVNFVVTRTNFTTLSNPQRLSSTQCQFALNGLAGQNYTIQAATNLSSDWFCLLVTNAPSAPVSILDTHATNRTRYYRVLIGP